MSRNDDNLIWVDLEMTGLDPDHDQIIEIASIVTNAQLETLAEGPVIAIQQPESLLAQMDDWNREHHTASGLVQRVAESTHDLESAQAETLAFVEQYVAKGCSPMCGNSICQDRRFMVRGMPVLEAWFHYRNIDVSTIKELTRRWSPDTLEGFRKKGTHQALQDIRESIAELQFYRREIFTI